MQAPSFLRRRRVFTLLALLAAGCGWAGSAAAVNVIHTGAHCRSTGPTTETSNGELVNDAMGVGAQDTVLYVCPIAMARNLAKGSVTVKVIGAINFRHNQSYCIVRSVSPDGSLLDASSQEVGTFATGSNTTRMVDTVTMTVTLPLNVMPVSLHLRCRLTNNYEDRPRNSIIMYWAEQ